MRKVTQLREPSHDTSLHRMSISWNRFRAGTKNVIINLLLKNIKPIASCVRIHHDGSSVFNLRHINFCPELTTMTSKFMYSSFNSRRFHSGSAVPQLQATLVGALTSAEKSRKW